MPAALLMQSAEHPTVYEPCVGVAQHNRLKNIGCDVCRKQFRNDHGLKIHEASASHRAKQLAADTPAQQIQRNDTIMLEAQPAQGQRHSVTLDIQPDQGDRHLDGAQQGPDDLDSSEPQQESASRQADQPQMATRDVLGEAAGYSGQHHQDPLPWPASIATLLPLLMNLSAADHELMFKVLTHPDFSAQSIPWKSADQLYTFLDENQVSGHISCLLTSLVHNDFVNHGNFVGV